VDPLAVARAALANLIGSTELEGASTITQQLYDARRELEGAPRPRTLGRKVRQAAWAFRESARRSKVEVLRDYLGIVYWGRSFYGLDAAAAGYFRTDRQKLTVAQGFFLAERIASPNVVLLNRIVDLMHRRFVVEIFDDDSFRELISVYDDHFHCGHELMLSLQKYPREAIAPA
jgi:penicillin-binding protein 1A